MNESVSIHTEIGSLLVGSYLNIVLYTLEIMLGVQYYRTCWRERRDPKLIPIALCFNFCADTVATVAICAWTYIFTVIRWGQTDITLTRQLWPTPVAYICGCLVAAVVQSFMTYRYWKMSSRHFVAGALGICIAWGMVGPLGLSITSAMEGNARERHFDKFFTIQGLSSNAGIDSIITTLLIWELYRVKLYFAPTKALIRRIAVMSIKTGCATTTVACTSLILYIAKPFSSLSIAAFFLLGRTYTCTMLFTLNHRTKLRGDSWIHAIEIIDIEAGDTEPEKAESINFTPPQPERTMESNHSACQGCIQHSGSTSHHSRMISTPSTSLSNPFHLRRHPSYGSRFSDSIKLQPL